MSERGGLFDLTGLVAVVSGASGWLGPSIVGALASCGAHVVAVSRDADRLRAALEAVTEDVRGGGSVEVAACDVTTPAWPQLVARVAEEHGRLDVLVNNAHVGRGGSLRTSGAAAYHEAVDLAVVATAESVKAAERGFAASVAAGGSPSVINISSMYGVVSPDPGMYDTEEGRNPPFYGAAKAAMLQLTRYAAAELGPAGVRVNAVVPGPFPATAAQADAAFAGRLASRTMLGRHGRPDEIRSAIVFLASPSSSFVTGSTVTVDGGWTAW